MRSHRKLTVIMTQTWVPVKDFECQVSSQLATCLKRTAATSGVSAVSGVFKFAVSYLVYLE